MVVGEGEEMLSSAGGRRIVFRYLTVLPCVELRNKSNSYQ